ncbi:MAG: hypothetical protein KAX58_02255 [Aeromonadaceae bacterium]|uniref:hypothetical protein n=1 Tax=Aeromonas dhakensis TaxID=196024 RepID=UPI001B708B23|nr:hypothetical protein [Aeromonadaceae bacterium]MCE9968950.1 hypothetical protein [Aeromonas salmonicida]
MKKLDKRVISNLIMFMRRDVTSKGDEAIAYCECMDALSEMLSSEEVGLIQKNAEVLDAGVAHG